ncbi:MAG: hypothetical protein L0H37_11555, partial [Nitrosospira sp.]|nr:hypothetical protein [Nitrosospira sp.]
TTRIARLVMINKKIRFIEMVPFVDIEDGLYMGAASSIFNPDNPLGREMMARQVARPFFDWEKAIAPGP